MDFISSGMNATNLETLIVHNRFSQSSKLSKTSIKFQSKVKILTLYNECLDKKSFLQYLKIKPNNFFDF